MRMEEISVVRIDILIMMTNIFFYVSNWGCEGKRTDAWS